MSPDVRADARGQGVTRRQRGRMLIALCTVNVVTVLAAVQVAPRATQQVLVHMAVPLANGRAEVIGRYLLMLLALLLVEVAVLGWGGSSLRALAVRPSASARSDLVLAALVVAGYGTALAAIASGGLSELLPNAIRRSPIGTVVPSIETPALRFAVWFLLADLAKYLYHRACHTVQFLWQAHKVHHAATEFTVLTGNRVHPLEHAGMYVTMSMALVLTGAPPPALFGVYVVQRVIDWLQHSPVRWDYGWFGRWVVFSPIGHRIHHSPLPEHWDRNFGDFLVIWDRLFGTWYDGPVVNEEVGLSTGEFAESGPLEQLLDAAVLSYRDLRGSVRTRSWLATHVRERRLAARAPAGPPPSGQCTVGSSHAVDVP